MYFLLSLPLKRKSGSEGSGGCQRSEKMDVLWCDPSSDTYSHGCWTFGLMKLKAATQGPRYLASTLQCLPTLGLFMWVSSSISLSFYIFDLGETVSRMRVREWDLSQHPVDSYAFPSLMPKTRGRKELNQAFPTFLLGAVYPSAPFPAFGCHCGDGPDSQTTAIS